MSVRASGADVNTRTYYYDRIPERAQWCYRFLKEYYDNIPLGVERLYRIYDVNSDSIPSPEDIDYTYDISTFDFSTVPGGNDAQLGTDFAIADAALKADEPAYDWKGWVSGYGADAAGAPLGHLDIQGFDLLTEDHRLRAEAKIRQVVSAVQGGDRYTQLRKLTEWFLDNTYYDPYADQINPTGLSSLTTRGIHYDGSMYGVLLEGIAVCGGFSEAVKVFCDRLGIPCIIMGNAKHAWNLVQMEDGQWYRLDITNACRLGWDGELPNSKAVYFEQEFLNNNTLQAGFGTYADPYMISLDGHAFVTEFPVHAQGQYQYTGGNTDFSYTLPASTYTPGSAKFAYRVNPDGKTCTVCQYERVMDATQPTDDTAGASPDGSIWVIVGIAAGVLLLGGGGTAAFLLLKKRAQSQPEPEAEAAPDTESDPESDA